MNFTKVGFTVVSFAVALHAFASAPPQKKQEKPLTPMPTAAECAGLQKLGTPFPFKTGETLDYDLDALGAKAGKLTMRVKPKKGDALPLEVHAQTNTFFAKIRRVDGTGTSFVSPSSILPARYFEESQENEWHRVSDVAFRRDSKALHLVATTNGRHHEKQLGYDATGLDVISAIYAMRGLNFKVGDRVCFDAYAMRWMWRVWGTVVAAEHVSLPIGEFDTLHLAGEAARTDVPTFRRGVHFWFTDDARKIPVAALGTIDLGAVRATLTSYARPGEKAAKAQKATDMKF